jgi:hypothetical protein
MTRVTKSRILWIGLVAGSLDITENIVFNAFRGITPWRIFQFIASGLIDGRSFQLGWASIGLGVVIHYAIALTWTAIFYIAATRFKFHCVVASADSLRVDLRHHHLRCHEFHRAATFGSSTSTGRGHTDLTGQRDFGVDVLYRIAGRAPGQRARKGASWNNVRPRSAPAATGCLGRNQVRGRI